MKNQKLYRGNSRFIKYECYCHYQCTGSIYSYCISRTYWLHVSATGYAAISRQVNINKESPVLTISLQSSFVRLDEVVVSAEKKEELLQTLPLSVTALTSRQVKRIPLMEHPGIDCHCTNILCC
jgi:hypothetical protein